MKVREAVQEFVNLGPLPPSTAEEAMIARHEDALHKINGPLNVDEATLLATCFGPDDCFGLAWTLLHLIETSPVPARFDANDDNEWIRRLLTRATRAAQT